MGDVAPVSVDDPSSAELPAADGAPCARARTPDGRIAISNRSLPPLVFLIVLLGLVAWRWPVLTMPLYEDQSVGFGREAEFLAQTDFDYLKLRYDERHFLFGGTARSYMISVIPTALAALSRVTGSAATTLLLWHLLSFCLAALVVALVVSLLQPWIGRRWALLSGVGLLTTPMFLAQADLAGMELPLAACSLLAAKALAGGRFVRSAGLAFLAFLMKATATLVSVAVLLVLTARRIGAGSTGHRGLTLGILVSVLLIAAQVAAVLWGDDTALFRATFQWPSAFRFPRALLWCPDLAVLCLITTAAGAAWMIRDGIVVSIRRLFQSLRQGAPPAVLGVLSFLVVAACVVSMFQYIFTPRYYILPLVFLYLLMPLLLFPQRSLVRVGGAALAILIALNLVNTSGGLYPPVSTVAGDDVKVLALFPARSCGFSERSLEYLADHRSSIEKIRVIASNHADDSVFLDMPHWIYLTSPFVGYVTETPPLAFRAENYTATIREFRDRAMTLPPDTDLLFLWSGRSRIRVPGPGEGLETLAADGLSPRLALVRVQRDRLATSPEALEDWYLDHTWSTDFAVHRILDRYEFLRKTGRIHRAFEELHAAKWLFPRIGDATIERQLAAMTLDLESALRLCVEFEGSTWMLSTSAGAHGRIARNETGQSLGISVLAAPIGHGESVRVQGPRRVIEDGQSVLVRFQIKANRNATTLVAIERLFHPERPFEFRERLSVTDEWQEFIFRLSPAEPERDAVLVFYFGQPDVEFEIKKVEFSVANP